MMSGGGGAPGGGPMGPVMVLNTKTQRQTGREAQISNIQAAKAVAAVIRTTLGPRSMLKMILDPMGSIVLTNDGHCILREIDVSHPTAKTLLEISRTQDEHVGDGTTSVIILTSDILTQAEPFLRQGGLGSGGGMGGGGGSSYGGGSSTTLHPTVIVSAYTKALVTALEIIQKQSVTVDLTTAQENPLLKQLVESALQTKFASRYNELMVNMAIHAVLTVATPVMNNNNNSSSSGGGQQQNISATNFATNSNNNNNDVMDIDIKRYVRIEKIPGGEMEDSEVLRGIMFQKEPVHAGMRRQITNPRILLLDCVLEYKKGESQTNIELSAGSGGAPSPGSKENAAAGGGNSNASSTTDWNTLLKLEEEYVEKICQDIIAAKPDIVITEKGVSDLAQHYLNKAGITAFRRLRKTDNNRIARAVGATVVSRTDEIQESDIGTQCGLFEMRLIGNDWFCYLTECEHPRACTLVLRGGSKDVLNEMERNLHDAMQVVRNVCLCPRLVYGGGTIEMAIACGLRQLAPSVTRGGIEQLPFTQVADAFEIIPRTLIQNCGTNVIRTMTELRAKHTAHLASDASKNEPCRWGINGETGVIVDMKEYGIYEPYTVKVQTVKSAMENACMILRIDDIVSGSKKQQQ